MVLKNSSEIDERQHCKRIEASTFARSKMAFRSLPTPQKWSRILCCGMLETNEWSAVEKTMRSFRKRKANDSKALHQTLLFLHSLLTLIPCLSTRNLFCWNLTLFLFYFSSLFSFVVFTTRCGTIHALAMLSQHNQCAVRWNTLQGIRHETVRRMHLHHNRSAATPRPLLDWHLIRAEWYPAKTKKNTHQTVFAKKKDEIIWRKHATRVIGIARII